MEKAKIKDIVLAITYRCNARCRMCGIWRQNEHGGEISPADLYNLPKDLESLNLSGGEPFLRMDLPEIVKIAKERCPKASLTISSNGFATAIILDKIKEIIKIDPEICVAISIDGLAKTHDEVRGILGGFEKAMATVEGLKKAGVKKIRLAFTIADYNYLELKKVYELSRRLEVEMTLAAVHSSDNYFGQENKISANKQIAAELDWLLKQEISSWDPKRWLRAYFAFGLKQFILQGSRILPDYSGEYNFFIDPLGDIYPCDISTVKIGNLKKGFGKLADFDKKECGRSWMICTARQAIRKHWLKAGWWIFKNKFLK